MMQNRERERDRERVVDDYQYEYFHWMPITLFRKKVILDRPTLLFLGVALKTHHLGFPLLVQSNCLIFFVRLKGMLGEKKKKEIKISILFASQILKLIYLWMRLLIRF